MNRLLMFVAMQILACMLSQVFWPVWSQEHPVMAVVHATLYAAIAFAIWFVVERVVDRTEAGGDGHL